VFGEATKFSRFLIDARKSYEAVLALGVETTSGDPEGEVVARREPVTDPHRIDEVLARFLGAQEQVPPMHSALHVNGRRLYDYARAGEAVERTPRRIEIDAIRRIFLRPGELGIAVACSKGTYIRVLAMDIGRALGCGASLTQLRRTSVGPFRLEEAWTLEAVERDPEGARAVLRPPETLVVGLPRIDAAADEAERFSQGQAIAGATVQEGSEAAVFGPAGRFLGVGLVEADGRLAPRRLVARNAGGCP
jgi:tRNA pseudouridine55 synthase